jgi:hypothetical protein
MLQPPLSFSCPFQMPAECHVRSQLLEGHAPWSINFWTGEGPIGALVVAHIEDLPWQQASIGWRCPGAFTSGYEKTSASPCKGRDFYSSRSAP